MASGDPDLEDLWNRYGPQPDLTWEDVAKEAGMSVSGVRKRLRALRETLVDLEAS